MSHPNHPNVDQSDRVVPINLRQSGRTPTELLISTRVRKSPFWHLSHEAGCWRATVYNRIYHPRGYVKPEDGGAMVEYEALVNRVTMWNVAVERQIRVKGPDAEAFTDFVITRDATKIEPMHGKYAILCNEKGGILNDPVLLRLSEDEFWFSISDSDLLLWMQGVNVAKQFNVEIDEIDVCPLQIQGPLSEDLMAKLAGEELRDVPYYGLMEANINGADCVISQTGFTGEKGYEIYVRDTHENAEKVWNKVLEDGEEFGLMVIAPAHHRRIAAGILSWGQDLDHETSPFQVNLAYQVPRNKKSDYIGKAELERQRDVIDSGDAPFKMKMVGITLGGKEITDYAPDFWLVADTDGNDMGYVTSPWWSPELETNIALAWVPWSSSEVGTKLLVKLPDEYSVTPGEPVEGEVVDVPFRASVNPNKREVEAAKGKDFAE
ncbi:MAG: aminomethyltransferase, glycine cleavage system T protein [SAR86 cluster bacterium SAR86A]|uniref:Aminomethyltransferase, glycine cleavage system T protein n=1 Tax=SAR86 cluster bacterium SAR86A TaxID=1123866 RepID=J4KRK8_9GAMM|nr:MAG: aminomethyltransferase, glycine cleavage system T protein [SAR86 cluster bacterium SAR86A]